MGNKLPTLTAKEVIAVLNELGFENVRQKGSHIFFRHPDGRTTLVSRHDNEDIGKGLLRHILKEIELTPEEFSEYLNR